MQNDSALKKLEVGLVAMIFLFFAWQLLSFFRDQWKPRVT
jgi:hypothetical protein